MTGLLPTPVAANLPASLPGGLSGNLLARPEVAVSPDVFAGLLPGPDVLPSSQTPLQPTKPLLPPPLPLAPLAPAGEGLDVTAESGDPPLPDAPQETGQEPRQDWAILLVPELAQLPVPLSSPLSLPVPLSPQPTPGPTGVTGTSPEARPPEALWPAGSRSAAIRLSPPVAQPQSLLPKPLGRGWQASLPALPPVEAAPALPASVPGGSQSPDAADMPVWFDPTRGPPDWWDRANPPPAWADPTRPPPLWYDPTRIPPAWVDPARLPADWYQAAPQSGPPAAPVPAAAPLPDPGLPPAPPPLVEILVEARPRLDATDAPLVASEPSPAATAPPPAATAPPPAVTAPLPAAPQPPQAASPAAQTAAAPADLNPAPGLAIASERLGEVAVRLSGSPDQLQVAIAAQPAAAALIDAGAPRLAGDMAAAGVLLAGLSVNGQRADLSGGGRRPARSPQLTIDPLADAAPRRRLPARTAIIDRYA